MARSRLIKPSFWSDEKLTKISRDARLFFIGLWNFADDYGVLFNSNRTLLGNIFPFDKNVSEHHIEKWKKELLKEKFIFLYKEFIIIRT